MRTPVLLRTCSTIEFEACSVALVYLVHVLAYLHVLYCYILWFCTVAHCTGRCRTALLHEL